MLNFSAFYVIMEAGNNTVGGDLTARRAGMARKDGYLYETF